MHDVLRLNRATLSFSQEDVKEKLIDIGHLAFEEAFWKPRNVPGDNSAGDKFPNRGVVARKC